MVANLLDFDLGGELSTLVKDNWETFRNWDQLDRDRAWLGLQIFFITGLTVYWTRNCWKNMLNNSESE